MVSMMQSREPLRLVNSIKNYAWGSRSMMRELFGIANQENLPQAEMWMGANLLSSSLIFYPNGKSVPLLEIILENPSSLFGKRDYSNFRGSLPFLFKLICVAKPLSLQAHPNLEQAREGFRRENKKLSPQAAARNYKDDNHKPELISAITRFSALNGFLPP